MTEHTEHTENNKNKQSSAETALNTTEQESFEDAVFDEQLRSGAHELRKQMQPSEEIVKKTIAAAQEAVPSFPAPTGNPVLLHPPAQNSNVASTTTTKRRRRNRTLGIFAAAAATVLVVVGGIGITGLLNQDTLPAPTESLAVSQLASGEIITPESYEEVFASLEERVFSGYDTAMNMPLSTQETAPSTSAPGAGEDMASSAENATALDSPVVGGSAEAGSDSYSTTNTQVEGVDEADIVKTDGVYIYSLSTVLGEVIISEADGKDTEEVSRISVDLGSAQDMYVVGNRLVLMATDGSLYYDYTGSTSYALVYDISNPEQPELLNVYGQDGNLRTSRLVDNTLYLVSVYSVYYTEDCVAENPETYVPNLYEGETEDESDLADTATPLGVEDIRILPEYESASYSLVTAIDVSADERLGTLSVLGNTSTVYMNEDNLFLAATTYGYEDIIVPLASDDVVDAEESAAGYTAGSGEVRLPILPWDMLASVLDPEGWNDRNNDAGEDMPDPGTSTSIAPAYSYKPVTRVMRLSLNEGHPELAASTVLDGTLLNQFSLDEYNGYLRIAMTVNKDLYGEDSTGNPVWEGTQTSNSLYVLDSNLELTGSIEDLAPDERIYSARFTGEVGYMVTFRETDPLFSLDLSDPYNPQVMDALKIPGFSEYLHPYADGLLLGIGQETDESGWTTGELKISMFEVSDPYDISEDDKLRINASYSPALDNHKAVLIDQELDIIGFEIETYREVESGEKDLYSSVWQNYYVIYGYSEDEGFYERAAIELPYEYSEARALYIGEYLYIVVGEHIGVYSLDTFKEIAWITP